MLALGLFKTWYFQKLFGKQVLRNKLNCLLGETSREPVDATASHSILAGNLDFFPFEIGLSKGCTNLLKPEKFVSL